MSPVWLARVCARCEFDESERRDEEMKRERCPYEDEAADNKEVIGVRDDVSEYE